MATKREKELAGKIKNLEIELDLERSLRKDTDIKSYKSESVIIISNRLPATLKKDPLTKTWSTEIGSGGLVSALNNLKLNRTWIGSVGIEIPPEDRDEVNAILAKLNCVPVYLPKDLYDDFYNGFSNDVLWPVLHYVQLPINTLLKERHYWYAYEEVNRLFSVVVLENSKVEDPVWVHDYHLMLLPGFIRQARPSAKIGWFLHTPFPNSDIYRTLSYREELLKGILASDLVGFHIYNYVRHFKAACSEILGCDTGTDAIELNNKMTLVDAFPIGINVEKFETVLKSEDFAKIAYDLRRRYGDVKIIIGVDRLDYIKGMMHKLVAFQRFLERNEDWVNRVTYVQIAVPTRADVMEYQRLSENVHELVGRINGKFSNLTHVPIHYLDKSIDLKTLTALYSIADICLITSLRDGMNLVSYEFIASQLEDPGVLILSEFAGAAQSLGAGCIQINPWNIEDTSCKIRFALTMGLEERKKLYDYAKMYVTKHSSQVWAEEFIFTIRQSWEISNFLYKQPKLPSKLNFDEVTTAFKNSKRRIIFCGVVGTLTKIEPFNTDFQKFLEYIQLNETNFESLRVLSELENTEVVIATSRRKEFLDKLFGKLRLILCAENGYYLKDNANGTDWMKHTETLNLAWMDSAEKVMQYFCERTPNSFIERLETSICWHYSSCASDFSEQQARDLISDLQMGPMVNAPTEVMHDQQNKFIKVRLIALNKKFSVERTLDYLSSGPETPSRHRPSPRGKPLCPAPARLVLPPEAKRLVFAFLDPAAPVAARPVACASGEPRRAGFDFVLCVGSYVDSDQDVFQSLNEEDCELRAALDGEAKAAVFTVSVGKRKSLASGYLRSSEDVEKLLRALSKCEEM